MTLQFSTDGKMIGSNNDPQPRRIGILDLPDRLFPPTAYQEISRYRLGKSRYEISDIVSALKQHPIWSWAALNENPGDFFSVWKSDLQETVEAHSALIEKTKTVDDNYLQVWISFYDELGDVLLDLPNEQFYLASPSYHKIAFLGSQIAFIQDFQVAREKGMLADWLDMVPKVMNGRPDRFTYWHQICEELGMESAHSINPDELSSVFSAARIISDSRDLSDDFYNGLRTSMEQDSIRSWVDGIVPYYNSLSGTQQLGWSDLVRGTSLEFVLSISHPDLEKLIYIYPQAWTASQQVDFLSGLQQVPPDRIGDWADYILEHYREDAIGGAPRTLGWAT